jgi:hypothetical protein
MAPLLKPSDTCSRRPGAKRRERDLARPRQGQGAPFRGPSEASVARGYRRSLPAQSQGQNGFGYFRRNESTPLYGGGTPLVILSPQATLAING